MGRVNIAKWSTRGGAHQCELFRYEDGAYTYTGTGCGGCLGVLLSDAEAVAKMERDVIPNIAPDKAKIGLQRIPISL